MKPVSTPNGGPVLETSVVFERVARTYDRLNHLFSFNADARWRRRLIEAAGVGAASARDPRPREAPRSPAILDVCTGTGDVAIGFALADPLARVTAFDFSDQMLAHARAKVEQRGLSDRVALVQGDAHALPFEDERFDVVSISFGLRTLADRPKAVRELARVTKSGGRLLVMEFAPPPATLFGALYRFYLHTVMPFLGNLLSGYRASYTYLDDSIAEFPVVTAIPELLREAGVEPSESSRLTGGIAYLFSATKR